MNNTMQTKPESIGMCGKMGKAISLYWLYRDTGEEEWKLQADALVEAIYEEFNENTHFSYGGGFLGLGVGIEYIIQHNFVDGNADEILNVIDIFVINVINSRPAFEISIENGMLGIAYYLYYRLCYRVDADDAIVLTLKEQTIYLIDWIADALMDTSLERNYHEVIFILLLLHRLNIFNEKIKNLMEWCNKELLTLKI